MTSQWQMYTVAPDQTHHLLHGQPAYPQRFLDVLKFHPPGLADLFVSVEDSTLFMSFRE